MACIVIFNESTNRVIQIIPSAHTPSYSMRRDVLINPDIPTIPVKYMKVNAGRILEASREEKAAIDASTAPSYKDLRRARYEPLDGEFHDALAKTVQLLLDNKIDIGEEMKNILVERKKIKAAYPKT